MFGQPTIGVGVMPGASGTQRLLRCASRCRSLPGGLTGQMIPARDEWAAKRVGEPAPKQQAPVRALAIGAQIATMPPPAVQAVRLGADMPTETALTPEKRLCDSEDRQEGMGPGWLKLFSAGATFGPR